MKQLIGGPTLGRFGRMDDLVDSNAVDVIKIDVEGAELGVLRGGEELIPRSRPTIFFENLAALSMGGFLDSHLYPRRTTNDFAVPADRRLEVRDHARRLLKLNVN